MAGQLFEERGAEQGLGGVQKRDYTRLLTAHQELSDLVDRAEECSRSAVMQGLDVYCAAAGALPGGKRGSASVFTCVRALQAAEPKALLNEFSAWLQVPCACVCAGTHTRARAHTHTHTSRPGGRSQGVTRARTHTNAREHTLTELQVSWALAMASACCRSVGVCARMQALVCGSQCRARRTRWWFWDCA
jgi:hypothetical protein